MGQATRERAPVPDEPVRGASSIGSAAGETATMHEPSYEADGYGWALRQAELLRQRRLGELDLVNIAEEIESVGKSEYGKLQSAIRIILMHLLKWDHQPEKRSRSWFSTIQVQRRHAGRQISRNPSLRPRLDDLVVDAYDIARLEAFGETDLDLDVFPATCPYSWDEIMQREITWPPSDPAAGPPSA